MGVTPAGFSALPSLSAQHVADHRAFAAYFHLRANVASTATPRNAVLPIGAKAEPATAQTARCPHRLGPESTLSSERPFAKRTSAIEIGISTESYRPDRLEGQDLVEPLEDIFRRSRGLLNAVSSNGLAERWREYHGWNDWKGLVDPLDTCLRSEIIKYGEFAQLTYDAFNFDEQSKNCGSCLYDTENLMREAGLAHRGYEVTKYLYATSDVHLPTWLKRSVNLSDTWSKDSNWIGFVAVATDEKEIAQLGRRDIMVAWRGTVTFLEWLEDLDGVLVPMEASENNASTALNEDSYTMEAGRSAFHAENGSIGVERGFWTLYTSKKQHSRHNKQSAAQQVREELRRLVEKYKGEKELSITMTGHSLGGALAMLSAFDVAASNINRNASTGAEIPVSVISFAAPKVGNESFKRKLEELGVKALRIVNVQDIVPRVPSTILEGLLSSLTGRWRHGWAYEHAGVELQVDSRHSIYLKKTWNLADVHNLEVYLHLVDSYKSALQSFSQDLVTRDLALVNKSSSLLIDQLNVPSHWLHKPKDGEHVKKALMPIPETILHLV